MSFNFSFTKMSVKSHRTFAVPGVGECNVCMEVVPHVKVFDCGHKFCAACTSKLISKASGSRIECPECRQPTDVAHGLDDMPTLYFGKIKCDLCLVKKCTDDMWWCGACVRALCSKCNIKEHAEKRHDISEWNKMEPVRFCVDYINRVQRQRFASNNAEHNHTVVKQFLEQVEQELFARLDLRKTDIQSIRQTLITRYGGRFSSTDTDETCNIGTPTDKNQCQPASSSSMDEAPKTVARVLQLAGAQVTDALIPHLTDEAFQLYFTVTPSDIAEMLRAKIEFIPFEGDGKSPRRAQRSSSAPHQQKSIEEEIVLEAVTEAVTATPSAPPMESDDSEATNQYREPASDDCCAASSSYSNSSKQPSCSSSGSPSKQGTPDRSPSKPGGLQRRKSSAPSMLNDLKTVRRQHPDTPVLGIDYDDQAQMILLHLPAIVEIYNARTGYITGVATSSQLGPVGRNVRSASLWRCGHDELYLLLASQSVTKMYDWQLQVYDVFSPGGGQQTYSSALDVDPDEMMDTFNFCTVTNNKCVYQLRSGRQNISEIHLTRIELKKKAHKMKIKEAMLYQRGDSRFTNLDVLTLNSGKNHCLIVWDELSCCVLRFLLNKDGRCELASTVLHSAEPLPFVVDEASHRLFLYDPHLQSVCASRQKLTEQTAVQFTVLHEHKHTRCRHIEMSSDRQQLVLVTLSKQLVLLTRVGTV